MEKNIENLSTEILIKYTESGSGKCLVRIEEYIWNI